ncbi:MAG TPA: bifunctional UDP-N-acetylmuramoyl-tripeptide:D-alanyl-D-alanine ligase/alanine racemase [Chitinophagaceae bacterium]|jgi:alanine racemase|nr:bifunctional UDP-N-acetylmuramoyl-tripeptide:D-alanyl-D-alanine ligase/alanine racemase [Chitinophagaceae bacterium]
MEYNLKNISVVIDGRILQIYEGPSIEHLLIDSRKVYSPSLSLFFALKGPRRNGHQFISELYNKGVRNFVVSDNINLSDFPEAGFLLVRDTLEALQRLAAFHRKRFSIPVIGITGSNGKTIVKEWLYQLLHEKFNIVRSPKSYNSQLGVPLSVWQINEHHELAIFEAGISEPGEMEKLEKIIQPTIGILTNIGEAHSENFINREEKLTEKLKLFTHASKVIAKGDDAWITRQMVKVGTNNFFWGKNKSSDLEVVSVERKNSHSEITLSLPGRQAGFKLDTLNFSIPFIDEASIENAVTCCSLMLVAGIERSYIQEKMQQLQAVSMRLELKKAINHCSIINDSYSADLSSLTIALNFLDQQSAGTKRTVILSDFLQTGLKEEKLYDEISALLHNHHINKVIGIGKNIGTYLKSDNKAVYQFYNSTEDFLHQFRSSQFKEETILIKGARVFEFEKIAHALEQKVHQTVLEINLNALVHNLKEHQKFLHPSTKIMAMVKAFAYGSGGAEIAGILQYHKVDYLGVAYADEGVELRKAGINLPVMIMNPEESTFDAIVENNLEPDIYSFEILQQFDSYLKQSGLQYYPIHIEVETGMNRLGFDVTAIKNLGDALNETNSFRVKSVFSHLAASEDPTQDEFTLQQHKKFIEASEELKKILGYSFIKHIANSAAIIRHPLLQMDMVRLGIGMYGVDAANTNSLELQTVATLKSTIAQIKHLKTGESVSYNRKGIVNRDSVIATIRIGYADGYSRFLGDGVGKMLVNGQLAPVIGTVCMDMTMIDVTDIPNVKEGDEVIVFGNELPIEQMAEWADTIPYEIMTGISQRVKRVYFEE